MNFNLSVLALVGVALAGCSDLPVDESQIGLGVEAGDSLDKFRVITARRGTPNFGDPQQELELGTYADHLDRATIYAPFESDNVKSLDVRLLDDRICQVTAQFAPEEAKNAPEVIVDRMAVQIGARSSRAVYEEFDHLEQQEDALESALTKYLGREPEYTDDGRRYWTSPDKGIYRAYLDMYDPYAAMKATPHVAAGLQLVYSFDRRCDDSYLMAEAGNRVQRWLSLPISKRIELSRDAITRAEAHLNAFKAQPMTAPGRMPPKIDVGESPRY